MPLDTKAFRASIFHFIDKPLPEEPEKSFQYIEDAILVVEDGCVKALGDAKEILKTLPPDQEITEYEDCLIMPGFIDAHLHLPQVASMASYGEQLLEWLQDYIFPSEDKFKDMAYAEKETTFFFNELLKSGTTSAAVFCSLHKTSAEALFKEAEGLNMRIIGGKVMMDRNGPEGVVLDDAESSYKDCRELIEKWHGKGRLAYAVTPRFAPACSESELEVASRLMKEFEGVYMQTHICENKNEIKWVRELFPWSKSYLDVYDHYDMLGSRTILAHALHLTDDDFQRVSDTETVLCPCPSSNFFLGSGLYKFEKAREFGITTVFGSDMGAGNWFCQLLTLDEAYKMAQLQGVSLSPYEAFYLITLGGARGLSIDDKVGNFEKGKEADFVVLDMKCTELIEYRMARTQNLFEKLFVIMMMGDDRFIKETRLMGQCAYEKKR